MYQGRSSKGEDGEKNAAITLKKATELQQTADLTITACWDGCSKATTIEFSPQQGE